MESVGRGPAVYLRRSRKIKKTMGGTKTIGGLRAGAAARAAAAPGDESSSKDIFKAWKGVTYRMRPIFAEDGVTIQHFDMYEADQKKPIRKIPLKLVGTAGVKDGKPGPPVILGELVAAARAPLPPVPAAVIPEPLPPVPLAEAPIVAVEPEPLKEPIEKACEQLYDPCTGTPLEPNTLQALRSDKDEDECETLYHPCSGSPITDDNPLKIIQKKILELQKNKDLEKFKAVPDILRNGNRLDLLIWLLNEFTRIEDINTDTLLCYKTLENKSYAPDMFESLWDVLIAMGFLPGFERQNNRFMFNGKVEDIERIPSLERGDESNFYNDAFSYLKEREIKTSSSGGASDITIFYKEIKTKIPKPDPCSYEEIELVKETSDKPRFVFCSSKLYKKEKTIEKYDILNIFGAAKKINVDEINKEILLLVSDEEAVKRVKEGARRKYISEEASDVFGQKTLIDNLRRLFDYIKPEYKPITEEKLRKIFENPELPEDAGGISIHAIRKNEPLSLLLHQEMTVNYISGGIRDFHAGKRGQNNRFLIGILPRGGKTYIAGGLISKINAKNIVVLLGAKSETQSQFIDELFYKFLNFNTYKIINVKDEDNPVLKSGELNPDEKHIFVMSIELFKVEEYVCAKKELEIDDEAVPGKKKKVSVCIEEEIDDPTNPGRKLKKVKMVHNPVLENRPLLKLLRGLLPGKKTPVDLFISDEAHLKQATQKAEKAVKGAIKHVDEDETEDVIDETLNKFKSIPIVYMTGTYIKPKLAFRIPSENIVIWDYEDVQKAKEMDVNIEYFTNSFGDKFKEALEYMILTGKSMEDIKLSYQSFPEIHLIETHFYPGLEEKLLLQSDDKGMPDTSKLFIINKGASFKKPSEWYLGFQFQKSMNRLLNFLGPSDVQNDKDGDDKMISTSVMTSIDRICQRTGDRMRLITSDFVVHSQLWFLPKIKSPGSTLGKRMMALTGIIFQHPWFRKYFNILAVSGVDWKEELRGVPQKEVGSIQVQVGDEFGTFQYDRPSDKPLKERILDIEERARREKKGLIILAQNMLNLGISLSCVNVVVLLDSGTDVDERIQKMYRALTQSPQKRDAFVIDLNYFRTINAVTEYQIQAFETRKKRPPTNEDKKKIISNIFDIYSINDDKNIFSTKELRDRAISEIYDKQQERGYTLPTDLEDGGKMMNKNIDDTIKIDSRFFSNIEPHKEQSKKQQKELIRKIAIDLKKAKALDMQNIFPGEPPEELAKKTEKDIEEIISKHLAYLDIFKILLRYGVFATDYKDIAELSDNLESNLELQNDIHDLLLKKGIIKPSLTKEALFSNIILPNLKIFLDSNKGMTYKAMKNYVNDDSKYPGQTAEVLDYINEHLAPKDIERQKYGEIYTPLKLVDEMLDSLPEEVWSNPKLKWLDPANGMGNFPIKAFLRLCEGLKGKMKDPAKHIVENMLFMIDINGKNNEIARKLFKKLAPDAKANIEKIDAEKGFFANKPLVFNGKKVNEFDIIIGNPPYNTPKTETGSNGNNLWTKFVMKSYSILNDKGYLLFVHPPGWKKPASRIFNPEKFSEGDYTGDIQQGQIWQVLKNAGAYKFIYTNDQRSKAVGEDYIDHFPAIDYYVYQKGGDEGGVCDIKNVFLGEIINTKGVRLNSNLNYLPNLLTKETIDILYKITTKEGNKPDFKAGFDPRGFHSKDAGKIKYIYQSGAKGPVYQYYKEIIENVNISKVVINYGGGIDGFYCSYIDEDEKIGVLHMTMFSKVDSDKEGKSLEKFFNSDIIKFIFLITQYIQPPNAKNEHIVANSITIPEGTADYYKFFGIEEHKKYIEEMLAHYEKFKAPKRLAKTAKAKGGSRQEKGRFTRKVRRCYPN
jgi:hypothetical protein